MGSKLKNVISKRRPRQNIISMILKKAKNEGSRGASTSHSTATTSSNSHSRMGSGGRRSSSRPRSGGGDGGGASGGGSGRRYHGSKKGILQSAVELTRRSRRAAASASSSSRAHRGKGKSGGRSVPFVRGQRAFYRSTKGIAKVTVVGIHHDAKLEPYYTIKLKDGKEKQTDGKHLNPVQEEAKTGAGVGGGGRGGRGDDGGGGSGGGKQRSAAADPLTDQMTESSSEADVIIEEVYEDEEGPRREEGGTDDARGTRARDDDGDRRGAPAPPAPGFDVGQDAYLRAPGGGVAKVRVLRRGGDGPGPEARYDVSLPDGSRERDVDPRRLATLMDLTSKELSALMRERNGRQRKGGRRERSRSEGRRPRSGSPARDEGGDAVADVDVDEGYEAAEEAEPAPSIASDQSSLRRETAAETAATSANDKEEEKKEVESPELALPPPTPIKMVEAKTEDGGKKMVPYYTTGMHVQYKNAMGICPAEILSVHLDDLMEPYYDVRLEDGREKQTDNAHITPLPEKGNGKDEEEGGEAQGEKEGDEDEDEEEEEEKSKEDTSKEETSREELLSQAEEEEVVDYEEEKVKMKGHNPPSTKEQQQSVGEEEQLQLDYHAPDKRNASPKKRPQDTAADVSVFSQDSVVSKPIKKQQDPTTAAANVASTESVSTSFDPSSVSALVQPAKFATGDDVLYKTSQGERLRAAVVRLLRDKKNRVYYVVRTLPEGREKQVYGHRLRPYAPREDDGARPRRSRSKSRGAKSRGQSRTRGGEVGRDPGHHADPQGVRRSDSVLSNSSRRSMASRERRAARKGGSVASSAVGREESLASSGGNYHHERRGEGSLASSAGNYHHERKGEGSPAAGTRRPRRTSLRNVPLSSSIKEGPCEGRPPRGRSKSTNSRRTSSATNPSAIDRDGLSRDPPRGRRGGRGHRSHSRAPSEEPSLRSAHHHHQQTPTNRGRSSRPVGVSMSSRAIMGAGGEQHSQDREERRERSTSKSRSISRLRNFGKNLTSSRKKKR